MKSTCTICGEPIVSSLDQTTWYHWPNADDPLLSPVRTRPTRHRASPDGEPIHGCVNFQPACPTCTSAGAANPWP